MPRHLGYYIKIISKSIENDKNNDMKKYDLTSQQFNILMFLDRNKDMVIYQKDIEEYLKVTGATASGILKRLENNGFITRKISCHNSKYKEICRTYKSEQFIQDILFSIEKNEMKMFDGFSDDDIKVFENYLFRIIKNIEKEKKYD